MTELMKQDYSSIMLMPIGRFYKLLKLKNKFDQDVYNAQKEELDNIK